LSKLSIKDRPAEQSEMMDRGLFLKVKLAGKSVKDDIP
jgi:hypothetical protein